MTNPLRPKRLRRLALTIGGIATCGLVLILANARAAQVEPTPAPLPVTEVEPEAPIDPLWNLEATPVERVGYRQGKRHVIEVVPLGPASVEVEISTARAFLAMRAAAADAGVELRLQSGFRSAEEQRALFHAWRKGRGNKAAQPGKSNHQSGRALDIAVNAVPGAYEWLDANAAAFGFKRTVKTEPWHWEYVEVPIARGAYVAKKKKPKRAKPIAHAKRPARRPAGKAAVSRGRVTASVR